MPDYGCTFAGGPLDGQHAALSDPQELEEFALARKGGEELFRFAYTMALAPDLSGPWPSGPFQFQYAGPVLEGAQAAAPTEVQAAGVMDPTAPATGTETPAPQTQTASEPAPQPDALQPQTVEGPLSTVSDAASTPSGQAESAQPTETSEAQPAEAPAQPPPPPAQTAPDEEPAPPEESTSTEPPAAPTEIPTSEPAPGEPTS